MAEATTTKATRDVGSLSRLMVLHELSRAPRRTLRDIADSVGITVQAVSEHLKRAADEGHVRATDDGYRITARGHDVLTQRFQVLKSYVDDAVRGLSRIDSTAARAGADLGEADVVGLFMERGELTAYPGKDSPSTGRAAHTARAGEDVRIENLEGIVRLEPGSVTFAVLPDVAEGGSRAIDQKNAKRPLKDAGLVIVTGPVGRHLAEAAGVEPQRFGGGAAAADASIQGVDVVVLVEAGRLEMEQERFKRAQAVWGLASAPVVMSLAD